MSNGNALWGHRDFLNVWAAETISVFGSQFYLLAMPLAAVMVLDATATEMGVLFAVEMLPFLLFGLLAGVVADRRGRRSIMIVCDLGRAATLAIVPAAWYFDVLTWSVMYVVAFAAGVMTAFFDIAYQAYLPALVKRSQLLDANSKLETSRASSQVAGPSIAGPVVDIIGAPFAILANSLSFLGSAVFLLRVKKKDVVEREETRQSVGREIREGLHIVFSNKTLRGIAGCTALGNLFGSLSFAILVLFMESSLDLSPSWIGAVFAVGAAGAVVGALVSSRVVSRLGLGNTIIVSAILMAMPILLMTLAYPDNALLVLMPLLFSNGLLSVLYNVNQVSLRQAITPNRLQGKMNASMRFLVWGVFPIGGLLGGVAGEALGLRTTILISGLATFSSVIPLMLSPIGKIRSLPEEGREYRRLKGVRSRDSDEN